MAKKKKRKHEEEKSFQLPIEIQGIIFIILAILGFGLNKPLGLVGKLVRSFAIFLFGVWDWVFLLILLVLGGYIIIKKQYPKFFDKKVIGFYIIAVGLLVWSHIEYVKVNNGVTGVIFEETWNDIMAVINAIMNNSEIKAMGGGIIGCSLAVVFNILFARQGTFIISILFIILGICLVTGISIFDYLRRGVDKGKEIIKKEKEKTAPSDKEEPEKVDYDEETGEIKDKNHEEDEKEKPIDLNKRTVIASIDELDEATQLRHEYLAKKKEATKEVEVTVSEDDIKINQDLPVPTSDYKLPTLDLLNRKKNNYANGIDENALKATEELLVNVLNDFGIEGAKVVDRHVGPSVTQYELSIKTGTKLSISSSCQKGCPHSSSNSW